MSTAKEPIVNPEDLPPAAELVTAVREAIAAQQDPAAVLDRYAPAIDELANAEQAGAFLGLSRASVYQERSRTNADGSPRWPASDTPPGRSSFWKYRTLVLHRATMPGQGSAGRGRPRKAAGQSAGTP